MLIGHLRASLHLNSIVSKSRFHAQVMECARACICPRPFSRSDHIIGTKENHDAYTTTSTMPYNAAISEIQAVPVK
jgi:hypothetical protein